MLAVFERDLIANACAGGSIGRDAKGPASDDRLRPRCTRRKLEPYAHAICHTRKSRVVSASASPEGRLPPRRRSPAHAA
jgi:hypothetical protein